MNLRWIIKWSTFSVCVCVRKRLVVLIYSVIWKHTPLQETDEKEGRIENKKSPECLLIMVL